jgi:hypothetical protein
MKPTASGSQSSRSRRTALLALAIAALALVLLVPALAGAEDGGGSGGGTFASPFSEPDSNLSPGERVSESATVKSFAPGECVNVMPADETDDQKMADPDRDGYIDCKPAAGSIGAAPNGKLFYFNALEGSENVKSGQAFEFGVTSIDDQSRLLSLGADDKPTFEKPDPVDGGANANGNSGTEPILPGLGSDETQNDGALFCADLNFLPNGKILAAGGTEYFNDPGLPRDPVKTFLKQLPPEVRDALPAPVSELLNSRVDIRKLPVLSGLPIPQIEGATNFGPIELQGIKNSRILDPDTGKWEQSGDMNKGRWYPTLVTLGDEKSGGGKQGNANMFVASGLTKLFKPIYTGARRQGPEPDESGRNVTVTETYDPNSGQWTENGTKGSDGPQADMSERSLPLFSRLHLLPNGHVFYNVGGQSFNPNGQAYDQATWNMAASYDPDPLVQKWKDLGVPGLGPNDSQDPENKLNFGFRGSTFSTMLPLRPDANGEYTKADFLTAGGLAAHGTESPGTYFPVRHSRITEVDTTKGDAIATRSTGPLANRASEDTPPNTGRWYSTTVQLPTDEVIAFSGADRDEVALPGAEKSVKQAELFDPKADGGMGAWRPVATAERPRTYHNTATLMADARVMIGGHATINTAYGNNSDVPGRVPNGHDPTFEIYTPEQLTQGALARNPRPVIKAAGACQTVGGGMDIGVEGAAKDIDSVVISRNTSLTHVVDADQRTVELPITERDGSTLRVAKPDSRNVVPDGPYMLFVRRKGSDGRLVPSVSTQLSFGGAGACAGKTGVAGASSSSACLPAGLKVNAATGIGPLRRGLTRRQTRARAGEPARESRAALRYCVRGGGRAYVAFDARGKARMVVSVAPRHRVRGIGRGTKVRSMRRRLSGERRIGRKQYVARIGRGDVVFGVRHGKVRYVAVVGRPQAGNLRLLRSFLRGVRLQ